MDFSSRLLEDDIKIEKIEQLKKSKIHRSKRLLIIILMLFGNINLVALHVNLSIGIISMTSPRKSVIGNTTIIEDAEFNWSMKQKGYILSAFSYGTLFGPLGGMLAFKFGGATVFGLGIFGTAITTILTPLLIRTNLYLYMFFRFLEGIFEILSHSSAAEIYAKWIPSDELPIMTSVNMIGSHFGSLSIYAIAGIVIILYGWPGIFYVSGSVAILWCIIWFTLVSNHPQIDKFITKEEQIYLKEKILVMPLRKKTPWKDIIFCKPVWTLCSLKFSCGCSRVITNLILPLYIKDRTNMDIASIGYITSLVQTAAIIGLPFFSCLASYLRNNEILSATKVHKMFVSVGYCSIGVVSILLTYFDFVGSIICVALTRFLAMAADIVMLVMPVDLARQYACLIYGIGYAFLAIGYIVTPTFVGYVVTNHTTSEWNFCFITYSIVEFTVAIFFMIFGSAKLQSWATSAPQTNC